MRFVQPYLKYLNKETLVKELRYVWGQQQVRQTIFNFFAQIFSMLVNLITSSIIVRLLGAHQYGKYTLLLTIIGILSIFSSIGFREAYSRTLLLCTQEKKKREVMGLGILIFLGNTFFLFFLTLLALPFIQLIYQDTTLTTTLFWANIFSCTLVFGSFFAFTTREQNHMYWKASFFILRPSIFICSILLFLQFQKIGIIKLIALSSISTLIPVIIYIIKHKPLFSNIKNHWEEIKQERHNFGKHIFIGRFFERLTYNLDMLMLGAFFYSHVGYYTLGNKLVRPIEVFSLAGSDALIKKFQKKNTISSKVIFYNILWWTGSSLAILFLSPFVIQFIWGKEFLIINQFLWILLINSLFHNLYHIYYNFLYTKGIGKKIKKYFYLQGSLNLVGNILFIPLFGILGACFATLLSNTVFFILLYFYYQYYIKNIAHTSTS